jgi:hypothetical protein
VGPRPSILVRLAVDPAGLKARYHTIAGFEPCRTRSDRFHHAGHVRPRGERESELQAHPGLEHKLVAVIQRYTPNLHENFPHPRGRQRGRCYRQALAAKGINGPALHQFGHDSFLKAFGDGR